MPTTEYSRGYNKGRSTGERKANEALTREKTRADQAVQRAERAEKQQGLGHCEDCAYWRRGGHTPNPKLCAWGLCEAPRAAGNPWGTWARPDDHGRNTAAIQTTPRFGCVVFMASNGSLQLLAEGKSAGSEG